MSNIRINLRQKVNQSTCIAPRMVLTTLERSGMDHTAFNPQRTHHACLYLVSVHQMAPPLNVVANI